MAKANKFKQPKAQPQPKDQATNHLPQEQPLQEAPSTPPAESQNQTRQKRKAPSDETLPLHQRSSKHLKTSPTITTTTKTNPSALSAVCAQLPSTHTLHPLAVGQGSSIRQIVRRALEALRPAAEAAEAEAKPQAEPTAESTKPDAKPQAEPPTTTPAKLPPLVQFTATHPRAASKLVSCVEIAKRTLAGEGDSKGEGEGGAGQGRWFQYTAVEEEVVVLKEEKGGEKGEERGEEEDEEDDEFERLESPRTRRGRRRARPVLRVWLACRSVEGLRGVLREQSNAG